MPNPRLQARPCRQSVRTTRPVIMLEYASRWRPKTNGDASKVFFWSFIAGFAETLVPNVIDKAVKQAEQAAAPSEG